MTTGSREATLKHITIVGSLICTSWPHPSLNHGFVHVYRGFNQAH